MSITLLHFADQHLGPAGSRLDSETGLNGALMDRYRCARFAVEDGIRRGARLVLSCGDLLDSAKPSPTEVHWARESFAPALEHGVRCLLLLGTHEANRNLIYQHALTLLEDAPGLRVAAYPEMIRIPDERDPAETALQIACLPSAHKARLLADEQMRDLSPADLAAAMREKLMDIARGLATQRAPGIPSVLIHHFSIDTAEAGPQDRMMMLTGDVTLSVHELAALGFDAVLGGHVHKPQVLHERPWIGYSGSTETVNQGERLHEHGYYLHTFEQGQHAAEFYPTPARQFVTLEAQGYPWPDQVPQGSVIRLRVPAEWQSEVGRYRNVLESYGAAEVSVEIERAETVRRREVDITAQSDLGAALDGYLAQHPDYLPMRDELLGVAQEVCDATA